MTPSRIRLALVAVLTALFCAGALGAPSLFTVSAQKTVHVKEYKKKDGTVVKAHDRKAPKSGGSSNSSETTTKASGTSNPKASNRCTDCDRDENGHIVRSKDAKNAFMRATGYPKGRPGYVVDHIVPLACHGADLPSNMQWQMKADAKAKDKVERAGCH